ncbi:MAG: PTS sugar transporter subunit IIB [Syntrophales bacterium]
MNFVLVRVDNRLVHGQILETWLPFLGAKRIVVVDDDVASDFFRETVIRMAVPREVEFSVYGVDDFVRQQAFNEKSRKKAILLFSKIADALRTYNQGFRFQRLNVGNIYAEGCVLRCTTSIALCEDDIRDMARLAQSGVAVELKSLPRDKALDFQEVLKQCDHLDIEGVGSSVGRARR